MNKENVINLCTYTYIHNGIFSHKEGNPAICGKTGRWILRVILNEKKFCMISLVIGI